MPTSKRKIVKRIKTAVWITLILLVIHAVFPRNLFLDIIRLNFDGYNDTSYVFNVSIDEFIKKIEPKEYYIKNSLLEIGDSKELYAIHITPYDNKTESYEYKKLFAGRECYFLIVFNIDSICQNKTKVSYNSSKSSSNILCGKQPYFNLHELLAFKDRWIEKKPSNIEIYEVLRYIGKIVGEKDMPPINYPKCLSKKQILNTFGTDNPFTLQEQFGD